MNWGEPLLPYPRSPYTPLHLPLCLRVSHRRFGDVSYYRDRTHREQTDISIDRWNTSIVVNVRSDGLRPPSLPIPLQKCCQLHFITIWVKFHPTSPHPHPHPLHLFAPPIPSRPPSRPREVPWKV